MRAIIRCRQTNTLALVVLALLLFADSAAAQLLGVSNLRISVAPRATDGTSNTIATLGQASDGTVSLIVRSFDRRTGFQQGTPFIGLLLPAVEKIRFTDVLVSVVFEPNDLLGGSSTCSRSTATVACTSTRWRSRPTARRFSPHRSGSSDPWARRRQARRPCSAKCPMSETPPTPSSRSVPRSGEVRLLPYLEQDNFTPSRPPPPSLAMARSGLRPSAIQDLGPIPSRQRPA